MRKLIKPVWTSRVSILLLALAAAGSSFAACSDTPAEQGADQPAAAPQGGVEVTIGFSEPDEGTQKASPPPGGGNYRVFSASFTDVDAIRLTVLNGAQPIFVNFPLEHHPNGTWSASLPFVPFDTLLTFEATAVDANGTEIFTGVSAKSFSGADQNVNIQLAATDDGATYELPRCEQIAAPSEVVSGETASVSFYLRGQTGETLSYTITPASGGGTFQPASGQITLVGTSASLFAQYTAPSVMAAQTYTHTILITNSQGNSISTTFSTGVVPESAVQGDDVNVDVTFNPSIISMNGYRAEGSDQVTWTAAVDDDQGTAGLSYQWGFTPDGSFSFAPIGGQEDTNPSSFSGYTTDVEGTLTLSVTDQAGGMTTLFYNVLPNLFPENVVADPNGLGEIQAGGEHTCARYNTGVVRCWGLNNVGQLGLGDTEDIGDDELPSSVASNATIVGEAKQVVAGNAHTCALLETGLVYCWGANQYGQLGYGHTNAIGDGEPVSDAGYVPLTGTAQRLAAGGDHTCAVMSTGDAICWGRNDSGQLGYGSTAHSGDDELPYLNGNVPINAAGQTLTVKGLALGAFHTCALLSNDTVKCWGLGNEGQLGYGTGATIGDNELPSIVGAVSVGGPVQKVVAGAYHTCALLQTGAVRCWGRGLDGELGNGGGGYIGDNELPTANGQSVDFNDANLQAVDIAAGAYHTCAIVSGGGVRCWGDGAYGKLGYGDQNDHALPGGNVNLNSNSASRITAGADHTCVFLASGAARCWGRGANGRLGYGSTQDIGDNELPSAAPGWSDISIAP